MDQNYFDHLYIISDCFQFETIIHLPEIGVPLIHMLGAIISGSQVFFSTVIWLASHFSFILYFVYLRFDSFGVCCRFCIIISISSFCLPQ